jgi:phage repressor protein C with HTH and peptisase S24 domain
MNVTGQQARRILSKLNKFSRSWETLNDGRRSVAIKVVVLCELLEGRGRAAELLDVADNTIDNYRHGSREPRHIFLQNMAHNAGLPVSLLNGRWVYENGVFQVEDLARQTVFELDATSASPAEPRIDMPPIPFAPGYDQIMQPQGFAEEQGAPRIGIPSSYWHGLQVDPKHVMVLIASGDSMEPTIADGAPVFIDVSDRALSDGRIYVFQSQDEFVIRRVQTLADGGVELVCDNAALYPPQRISKTGLSDLQVVGRVRSSSSAV